MSITSTKSGATGISLALDNNFMEPIASALVGSGGSSIVIFNDIPQTYKHLQIRMHAATNRGAYYDSIMIACNSDVSLNYTVHRLNGTGASVTVDTWDGNPQGKLYGGRAGGAPATSVFGAAVIDILDYSNTNKFKTVKTLNGVETNLASTGEIQLTSGMWMSKNPISSLSFVPGVGTLLSQYTRISLYGIKG